MAFKELKILDFKEYFYKDSNNVHYQNYP